MRLIDGDALLRNIRRAVYPSDLATTIAVGICESHVKDMPTIDAVPVVRCYECEYYYDEKGACALRDVLDADGEVEDRVYVDRDFFCRDGERRCDV